MSWGAIGPMLAATRHHGTAVALAMVAGLGVGGGCSSCCGRVSPARADEDPGTREARALFKRAEVHFNLGEPRPPGGRRAAPDAREVLMVIRHRLVVPLLLLAACLDWPEELLQTDARPPDTARVEAGADLRAFDLGCPSSCTNGCKGGVCRLACTQSPCVCPPGYGCEVDCGQGDCSGRIDCSQATACDIRCNENGACPGG